MIFIFQNRQCFDVFVFFFGYSSSKIVTDFVAFEEDLELKKRRSKTMSIYLNNSTKLKTSGLMGLCWKTYPIYFMRTAFPKSFPTIWEDQKPRSSIFWRSHLSSVNNLMPSSKICFPLFKQYQKCLN